MKKMKYKLVYSDSRSIFYNHFQQNVKPNIYLNIGRSNLFDFLLLDKKILKFFCELIYSTFEYIQK